MPRKFMPKSKSKPFYKKKKMSADAKASLALKKVKQLEYNEELKNIDGSGGQTPVTTTEYSAHLSNIAQGDTQNSREGLKVTAKSLLLRMQLVGNSTAVNTVCRIIVVIDNDNTGTPPTLTNILQSVGVLGPKQIINQAGNRFTILMDKAYAQNTNGPSGVMLITKYFKLQHQIHYTSTASTDEREGNIWLFAISDQGANGPAFTYYSRLRFTDS